MIVGGVVVPTSLVLVPEVGRGRERAAVRTIGAYRRVGRYVQQRSPETLLLLLSSTGDSPELCAAADGGLLRDFAPFDSPELNRRERADADLRSALLRDAASGWGPIPLTATPDAALSPAYFLSPAASMRVEIARVPSLGADALVALGHSIRTASEAAGRRVLVAACGELSSRLFPGAPGGFDPAAPAYDERLVRALQAQDVGGVQRLSAGERGPVGESLWAQLTVLIAAMTTASGDPPLMDVLAYEAPFGVGYLVATAAAPDAASDNHESPRHSSTVS